MPNRNGMTTQHAMWPGKEFNGTGKPDTANVACMKNCVPEAKVASMLPDYARNAHGNLADQNRLVGQQHGANTAVPENKATPVGAALAAPAAKPAVKVADPALALLGKHNCTACHAQNTKVVGPSFNDIAKNIQVKPNTWRGRSSQVVRVFGAQSPCLHKQPPKQISKPIANWLAAGAAK